MSGGGGSNDGSNDMQVSGMEAALSQEKGISTHADTRVQQQSFSPGGDGQGQSVDQGGVHDTGPVMGPDRSTQGIAAPDTNYSDSEIEKGYTDDGQKLANVNGKYMTKTQMYNTGIVEKDPTTGEDVQGRYTINPNTGKQERTDMSFSEHWKNAPDAIKYSPTLRFLYASGKNVGEWASKKGFQGYNEAGQRPNSYNFSGGNNGTTSTQGGGNNERDMMNAIAPEAPYIVSGITPPSSSPAANWYSNLGTTNTNQHGTSIATQYAAAKTAVSQTLQNKGAIGMLAVNKSPFYDWLKTNKIDKGIL